MYKLNIIYQPHFQRIIKYMPPQIKCRTIINDDLLWSMNGSCCTASYRSTNKSCFDHEVKGHQLYIQYVWWMKQICSAFWLKNILQFGLLCKVKETPLIKLDHTTNLQQLQQNLKHNTWSSHDQSMFSQILSKIKDVFLPAVFQYV